MKITLRSLVVSIALIALLLPLISACDDSEKDNEPTASKETATIIDFGNDESPISPATLEPTHEVQPAVWVYNVNYLDQVNEATVQVVANETVGGTDYYVTETKYSTTPSRVDANGRDVKLFNATSWLNMTTLDELRYELNLEAMGMIKLTNILTNQFTSQDHGFPFSVGKKWNIDTVRSIVPELAPDMITNFSAEVMGVEDVTVPAGIFSCYRVEYAKQSVDGVALESPIIDKLEWWSIDEGFITPIKIENYAYAELETSQLVSYTPLDQPVLAREATIPAPTPLGDDTFASDQSDSQRLMAGQAWEEFCDTIKAAGQVVLREDVPGSQLDRAEGFLHITRMLRAGMEVFIENGDPDFPHFSVLPGIETKYTAENQANLYLWAPVRGDATYRVTGPRGTVKHINFRVMAGFLGMGASRTVSSLESTDMVIKDDGTFELILSPDPHPCNWIPLEPDATTLVVRQSFDDWDNEQKAELRIVQVGKEGESQLSLQSDQMAERLDKAAEWTVSQMEFWTDFALNLNKGVEANTLRNPPQSWEGIGASSSLFSGGWFDLSDDEALIIEVSQVEATFWIAELSNFWFESLDYATRLTCYTGHQAYLDSDGIYRFVIAHQDPGVPNWLDTAGHQEGNWAFRWTLADWAPTPEVKLVRFDDIWDEFPEDTPLIEEQFRKEQIAKRQAHLDYRYNR